MDTFDRLLPVITLVLGSVLTWFLQRTDTAQSRRLVAGESLAELRRHIWTKGGDEDWINLQVYLGTLRIRLLSAGVPDRCIAALTDAAEQHWSAIEHEDEHGWVLIDGGRINSALNDADVEAHFWLRSAWQRGVYRLRRRRNSPRQAG